MSTTVASLDPPPLAVDVAAAVAPLPACFDGGLLGVEAADGLDLVAEDVELSLDLLLAFSGLLSSLEGASLGWVNLPNG